LRSLDAVGAALGSGPVPGFFPRKRWKFPWLRLHLYRTFSRRFQPIVSFKNLERCHVIAVVVLPMMHEGWVRMDIDSSLANLLDRKYSRRQANLIETMRNRSFVDVARRMGYLEEHVGSDFEMCSLILLTTMTSAGRPSDC